MDEIENKIMNDINYLFDHLEKLDVPEKKALIFYLENVQYGMQALLNYASAENDNLNELKDDMLGAKYGN